MNGYLLPLLAAPILLLLAWLYHWMAHVEPNQIEITHHDVLSPDIPAALDGLRVCQLADLHIGAAPRNEAAIAAALQSVRADLYVLTGDMIYRRNGIPAFFRWLDAYADLLRPAVAVLGNAEHKRNLPTQEVSTGLAQGSRPRQGSQLRHGFEELGRFEGPGTRNPGAEQCRAAPARAGHDAANRGRG